MRFFAVCGVIGAIVGAAVAVAACSSDAEAPNNSGLGVNNNNNPDGGSSGAVQPNANCPSSTNACGGCQALSAAPGGACGSCGVTKCVGTDGIECAEAPEMGKACGRCKTSTNTCASPGVTACSKEDDRTNTTVDLLFPTDNLTLFSLSRGFATAIGWKPTREGSVQRLTLKMIKAGYFCPSTTAGGACMSPDPICTICEFDVDFNCNCYQPTAGAEGNLTAKLYRGAIGTIGPVLATATVPTATITGIVELNFDNLTTPILAGADLWIELETTSSASEFLLRGGVGAPASLTFGNRAVFGGNTWTLFTANANRPSAQLSVLSCL